MDRLRLFWSNINRLEGKQKTIALGVLILVIITWLAVCGVLGSILME